MLAVCITTITLHMQDRVSRVPEYVRDGVMWYHSPWWYQWAPEQGVAGQASYSTITCKMCCNGTLIYPSYVM